MVLLLQVEQLLLLHKFEVVAGEEFTSDKAFFKHTLKFLFVQKSAHS